MKAEIISFEDFNKLKLLKDLGKIVATSGGYDPVHPGHLYGIHESKKLGDTMVVIVNGDNFLRAKKGKPFIGHQERMDIISYVKGVDYVIPYETETDHSCIMALNILKPYIYTKSGNDRTNKKTIPEWETCEKLGIEIVIIPPAPTDTTHSSNYLKRWNKIYLQQKFKVFVNPYNHLYHFLALNFPANLKSYFKDLRQNKKHLRTVLELGAFVTICIIIFYL